VEHCDETLQVIPDELFQRAQKRNRIRSTSDARMKSGGRPKYLLSGLLHCSTCNAHYILHDARSYACSGHKGGACDNHIRVRRDRLESAILGPLRNEMLAPERVAQMAKEMQMNLLERIHKTKLRAAEQPHELMELDSRITRLRKRMAAGDPDITPDELRAALDLAEYKRRELACAKPADISEGAKLLTMLPNAQPPGDVPAKSANLPRYGTAPEACAPWTCSARACPSAPRSLDWVFPRGVRDRHATFHAGPSDRSADPAVRVRDLAS
jgi:hypothetical protein